MSRPSSVTALLLVLFALLSPGPALAARRLAVLVGANAGWDQDRPLRYAEEDARRLGDVLSELGGFPAEAIVLLRAPTAEQLRAALDAARQRLAAPSGEETLFVFYYSGHADERHLHLRGTPLSFEELHRRLRELPATVKLGILDACRSGSILSAKGGRPTSTFSVSVQDSPALQGTVLLTSSGADELSQEARALSGSFFTHHLVSGLRGAADEDGDRQVSLEEVYRYASVRTLLDTARTPTGAQRPAFRYELKGRGQLVLTRLLGPVATLQFPRDGQRCFLTDASERWLLAEIFPKQDGSSRLVVPVGSHLLKCVEGPRYRVAPLEVKAGQQVDAASLSFREAPLSEGVLKGGYESQEALEALAHRLASQAELTPTERPEQLERGTLLAVESLRHMPTFEAQHVLHRRLERLERLPRRGRCMEHEGPVLALAWSPEGRHLASAGEDGTARVWEVATGAERARLAHDGAVREVAWSPDGKLLRTRRWGEAHLWEPWSAREPEALRQPLRPRALTFDPTGRHLAAFLEDLSLRVVETASGREVWRVPQAGHAARFSPDGTRLAAFDARLGVRVWTVATGREVLRVAPEEFAGADAPATAPTLAFSPDGGTLALVGRNPRSVQLWDLARVQQRARVFLDAAVSELAFTPDGASLLAASGDGSVRVWEARTGEERARMRHGTWLLAMALAPDGGRLAAASPQMDSAVVWDVPTGQELVRLEDAHRMTAVAWSPEGDRLAVAGPRGGVCLWEVPRGLRTLLPGRGAHAGMAFRPDGGALVTATRQGPVRVWETATGRERARGEAPVTGPLVLSPDGRLLAAVLEKTVHVWEASGGRELARMPQETLPSALTFSPDGTLLAATERGGVAGVWEAATGRARGRFSHGGVEVEAVAFSADGKALATASAEGLVRVWNLASGQERVRLSPPGAVRSLAFSPDGQVLATAAGEPVARLWSVETGKELSRLTQGEVIRSVQYSADGRLLVTAGDGRMGSVWEAATGRELARVPSESAPRAVLLSPDGRHLALAREDGTGRGTAYAVHPWRTEDLLQRACALLRRNLTRDEWLQALGEQQAYRKTCEEWP